MGKIKINLNAIKANQNISINKIIDNKGKTITKNKANLPPPAKLETLNNKEAPPKKKATIEKINLSSIKKDININTSIQKKDGKIIQQNKKEDKSAELDKEKTNKINTNINKEALFENYESVFKKDKLTILEHLKKLKSLPKTNVILLSILVSTTIAGIGFLFYTNPKIHNLDNYKTSIIDTYKAITSSGQIGENNKTIIEKINIGGYIYNIKIQNILGKKIYIYKKKYFDKKENLNNFINKDIEYRKRDKIVKVLKNNISK